MPALRPGSGGTSYPAPSRPNEHVNRPSNPNPPRPAPDPPAVRPTATTTARHSGPINGGDPAPVYESPYTIVPHPRPSIRPTPIPETPEYEPEVVIYIPPPPPAPFLPSFTALTSTNFAIKQAPIDTIVFDEATIPVEMMMELLYDSISGLELANMSRTDLINGIDVVYSPIANLADINKLFNPNNIIAAPNTLNNYLASFAVNLILRGMNIPEFDEDGNLVVEIDEVLAQEEINVQISSSGTIDLVEI